MSGRRPKVVAVVLAYRHRDTVRQALESVLAQRGPFDLEVLVGEDCSGDGTAERVLEVAAANPGRVLPILRPDRSAVIWAGGTPTGRANFVDLLARADGDYLAFLDGDDRWTDPDKVARQIRALEQAPWATGCFGRVTKVDGVTGEPISTFPGPLPARVGQRELLASNPVTMGTMLWRRGAVPAVLPRWYLQCSVGDFALHLICTARGPYLPMDEVFADYRLTGSGVWTSRDPVRRLVARGRDLALVEPVLAPELIPEARRRAARAWLTLAWRQLRLGDRRAAREALAEVKPSVLRSNPSLGRRYAGLALAARVPGAGALLRARVA